MKKHAVIQNALWLIGGRFVRMVISMMLGMLTARYLGPSDYGLLNHAAAYTGFFCSVCNLGLDGVLTRKNQGKYWEQPWFYGGFPVFCRQWRFYALYPLLTGTIR